MRDEKENIAAAVLRCLGSMLIAALVLFVGLVTSGSLAHAEEPPDFTGLSLEISRHEPDVPSLAGLSSTGALPPSSRRRPLSGIGPAARPR